MKITPGSPPPAPLSPPAGAGASAPAPAPTVAAPTDHVSLAAAGTSTAAHDLHVEMASSLSDLPEEPAPKLQRPVLLVHGFMGDASNFNGMAKWLERDGVNRSGGVIHGGQPFEADPNGDFFGLEFSKPWNPIERNASELKAAVDEICRKTGASSVDVVAHSKGGLDVRMYLMNPDEKIDHVLLLGTPNHGALLADLGAFARERLHIPAFPLNNDPDATRCLNELSVDHVDRHGTPNNPLLRHLNEQWEVQRGRAQFLNIAGTGIPTAGGTVGVSVLGDGMVAQRSAVMPGVPFRRLWFRSHTGLLMSKSVMREMASFFGGATLKPYDNLFDSPDDRQQAAAGGFLGEAPRNGDGFLMADPQAR